MFRVEALPWGRLQCEPFDVRTTFSKDALSRESIARFVADTLTTRSLFRQVVRPELRTRPEYVLTGSIDRLEEIDAGRDVRVICTLSMQLTEAESGNE